MVLLGTMHKNKNEAYGRFSITSLMVGTMGSVYGPVVRAFIGVLLVIVCQIIMRLLRDTAWLYTKLPT